MKNNELELCDFNLIKSLKNIGFNLVEKRFPCKPYFNHLGELDGDVSEFIKHRHDNTNEYDSINTCSLELVSEWFRIEHKIFIDVSITLMNEWYVNIYNIDHKPYEFDETYEMLNKKRYSTYNKALIDGLKASIKLIK